MYAKSRILILIGLAALAILVAQFVIRIPSARALTVQGGLLSPSRAAASPQISSTAITSTITYQGQLQRADAPVSENCDFQFGLWDAGSGGVQIGVTQTITEVSVTDGLFTTRLNSSGEFGPTAFNGDPRWLEIAVICPAGGTFTTLAPRQPLTPAPYALFAADVQGYANIVVVAKAGGDYASIQAALDSITDASAANRYLVRIAPGTYVERVTMKPYVDLEGAGEFVTRISYGASPSAVTGTVVGADDAELRFLSVENSGGDTSAFAIFNNGTSPRLTHVTARASGGSYNIGVYSISGAPIMSDVTVRATGAGTNYGVSNNNATTTMNDMTVVAAGGSTNYGIFNASSAHPTIRNVVVDASGGSNRDIGVYNTSASASIQNSDISGGWQGIYNTASGGSYAVTVRNSRIAGSQNTIRNDTEYTTRLGASLLDGGSAVANGGTLLCADSHNGSAQELGPDCGLGKYGNVLVVAKVGGDYNSVQAALNSITNASSNNPYLVWVAPGIYTEKVAMKPYVDIEGAGQLVTKIASPGFSTLDGTIVGAVNAEIRSLTVENTGGDNYAIALFNNGASTRISQVTALAADGSVGSYGVYNSSASPVIDDVRASATAGGFFSYGVYNTAASPAMKDVTSQAAGSSLNYGVSNNNGSSPVMENVTAIGQGLAGGFGMVNNSSSAVIRDSEIRGDTVGISNNADAGAFTLDLDNSQISGSAAALASDVEFTTRIGSSLLQGGPVNANGGTMNCANSHNSSGQNLGRDCLPGNILLVARTGGEFTSIQTALDVISDASSTNRYLVRVGPGVYNEQVVMKPYVDIEGAGELATTITFTGSQGTNTGTVVGASDAELRFLTVENTGDDDYAVAIYNTSDSLRLTHITANATGGVTSYGIYNTNASLTMNNVTASAGGAADFAYGVYIHSASAPVQLSHGNLRVTNVGVNGYGLYIVDSDVYIQNSLIRSDRNGIYSEAVVSGSYTVEVNNSQIRSGSWTARRDSPEFTFSIGATLLAGGTTVGFPTCAGVYDENYVFYNGNCP